MRRLIHDEPTRLHLAAIAVLTVGGPCLLFPEVLPPSVRALVVVSGTVAALLLAIALTRNDRPVTSLVSVLALAAVVAWLAVPASPVALSHFAGFGFGLLAMSTVASWCRTENRLAVAAALFLLSGLTVLSVGLAASHYRVVGPHVRPRFFSVEFNNWLPYFELPLPGIIAGAGVNKNALGGTALLVLPVGASLAFLRKRHRKQPFTAGVVVRSLGVCTAVVGTFVLLVSESRSAWVAGWITLVVLCSRTGSRWRSRALGFMILGTVSLMVVASLWVTDRSTFERARESTSARSRIWQEGWEQLKSSRWVVGIGFNEFRRVSERRFDRDIVHAHNIFLQTALDLGVIGLAAYGGLVGLLLYRSDQAARGRSGFLARTAAGAGLALVGVHGFGLGDAISLGARVGLFQWLSSGLILATWRLQHETRL